MQHCYDWHGLWGHLGQRNGDHLGRLCWGQLCGARSTEGRRVGPRYRLLYAFAALLSDGSGVCWSYQDLGGDSSQVQVQRRNVQMLYSTESLCGSLGRSICHDLGYAIAPQCSSSWRGVCCALKQRGLHLLRCSWTALSYNLGLLGRRRRCIHGAKSVWKCSADWRQWICRHLGQTDKRREQVICAAPASKRRSNLQYIYSLCCPAAEWICCRVGQCIFWWWQFW